MAQAFTKILLSGSTNGKGILIAGTATGSADTIHTAVSGTSSLDEIWLEVYNQHTAPVDLTIEWGETSNPRIWKNIPVKAGSTLIVAGRLLQNSLVVKAFASVTNKLVIDGFVNRIV